MSVLMIYEKGMPERTPGKTHVIIGGEASVKKYEIAVKKTLTPEISQISVYAPLVAAKAS